MLQKLKKFEMELDLLHKEDNENVSVFNLYFWWLLNKVQHKIKIKWMGQ